jgi:hypothetical protein
MFLPICALFLRYGQVHRPDHRRGRIDGHRSGHIRQRDLIEKHFHVRQRTDSHSAFSHFTLGQWMIRVVAHERRQIKRGGKSRLALRKQVAKALIRILRGAKPRELPHGPQPATMHR